jgi:plastocyanin
MNTRNAFTATLLALLTAALPVAAATHFVQQDAFAFSPDVVVINVGDTVTWQWTSFSHTVTNGTGSTDPNVGRRFDAALSSLNPTFSFTFTTAGTVPYFCRPHELMGMSGTVIVQNTSGVDQVPARGPLALGSAPNPFNPRTLISFTLPADANVRLSVHDAAGRLVRVLEDGVALATGRHERAWDGLGDDGLVVPAGVYVATVEAGDVRETVKLTLAK